MASPRSLRGLDLVNFFLADVQTGVGPFLAIYLAGRGWNEQRVGLALTLGGLAGIAAQLPAGALIDRVRHKRALVALALAALAAGALATALFPALAPVLAAQVLIGAVSSVFVPVLAALALGLVGRAAFDRRQGRNQAYNAAGNVCAALSMGLVGYFVSNRAIFFFVAAATLPTLAALSLIRPDEIDHQLARGCAPEDRDGDARAGALWRNRPLLIFLACAVLFHVANAALLPLVGELLAKGKGRSSMMFMSACVIVTQLTITLLAAPLSRLAGRWGRKPLLLVGFAALPLRALLYEVTAPGRGWIAIQLLDGLGAGVFNVLSVLVIADLTRGSGRFNLTQGAIATAVGIGAASSQLGAGALVHHFGYHVGFGAAAAVAGAAWALLWLALPESGARTPMAAAPQMG